jgi:hypothetical protein
VGALPSPWEFILMGRVRGNEPKARRRR